MNVDIDQLATYSEEKAVARYFDGVNYSRLTWFLMFFFFYGLAYLTVAFFSGDELETAANPILIVILSFFVRRIRFIRNHFYGFILSFHVILFAALVADPRVWHESGHWLFLYPFLLIWFRLKPSGYLILHGIILATTFFHATMVDRLTVETIAGVSIAIVCLPTSLFLTWRHKRRFLVDWTRARNNRDRLRMKKELEQAREIQLSFLPPGDPEPDGIELSAMSEPATEVGGDYYDYYRLDRNRLAVIIGDVSGHGVASGLVLSGVRSCLHLIREQLTNPGAVLTELNRVLKETTDKKTFMTMLLVVVDTQEGEAVLANAGHVPMIHYHSRDRLVEEIRRPALPLGALLEVDYEEFTQTIEPGDLLILYSDGLTEIQTEKGEDYGVARLLDRVTRCGISGLTARGTRDNILEDVRRFKDDAEQLDDITLVVIRIP